ncbi:MAG: Hint domain-containing protein [Rhodobacteraceae bacterium]|nr:Hint domain-containing protein [Paracoccaceae bacterium]
MIESGRAMDGLLITGQSGFLGGTHVASNLGWRAIEALSVGDKVLTFDHGMQVITGVQRETQIAQGPRLPQNQMPLLVPQGALNNRLAMWLMPDQGLMVEYESAEDPLGDPFAVIPASALHGFRGIERVDPGGRLDVTILAFAQDEVIYVEGGMLAHCPKPHCLLSDDIDAAPALYDVMNKSTAEFLVECLSRQDGSADAFTCDPEEFALFAERQARPVSMLVAE